MKFERLGWVVAAALAGAMFGMGFQGTSGKTGTVNIQKVFESSDFAKKQTELLRNMAQARQGSVEFVQTHPSINPEDAAKFRELTAKATPTALEKTEIERIRKQAQADEQRHRELTTKGNLTDADVKAYEDLNRRREANKRLLGQWSQEIGFEIQDKQNSLRQEALDRVDAAVAEVARKEGYSIVFSNVSAPYAANDLTDATLKAMNNKK